MHVAMSGTRNLNKVLGTPAQDFAIVALTSWSILITSILEMEFNCPDKQGHLLGCGGKCSVVIIHTHENTRGEIGFISKSRIYKVWSNPLIPHIFSIFCKRTMFSIC